MIPMYIDYAAPGTSKATSVPTGIRVVLLESDGYNLSKLRTVVSGEREFVIAAQCTSWPDCRQMMEEMLPELLIARADLIPDGWSGERETSFAFPVVVAVDGFQSSASQGYEIIDRVTMPLDSATVQHAIARARSEILSRKAAELSYLLNCYALEAALGTLSVTGADFSAIPQDRDILSADLENVLYLQADRNYIRVHTVSGRYEVRDTMNHVLSRLDPDIFVRIHRSVIINLVRLKDVVWFNDVPVSAILEGGARMRIGPNYRGAFRELVPRKVA
jgi:two-component system LytT family response regulator